MNNKVGKRHGRQPAGAILYAGESRIDSGPIVCVVTFHSDNAKTGDMAQTWIFRADVKPTEASKAGLDLSVCGECLHMGNLGSGRSGSGRSGSGRSCYVNLGHGPRAVYNAWKEGLYPLASDRLLKRYLSGRSIRFGAYGDPCAVPLSVWERLASMPGKHTGYTHAWRNASNAGYRPYLMASVDSVQERTDAKRLGWRTFRVRLSHDPVCQGEIVCPSSQEEGYRLTCNKCFACHGYKRDGQADVVIIGHGNRSIASNLNRNLESIREGGD